jgi:hypothetical protein
MTERDRDLQALAETVDFHVYWFGVLLIIFSRAWPMAAATLIYFLFIFPEPYHGTCLVIGFGGTVIMMTRDPTKVIAWVRRNVWRHKTLY